MTKLFQIYKCGVCGNMVEVIFEGKGELVCCGQPMDLVGENVVDASVEKHVPVFEKEGDNLKVKVGSVPHPMEEKHYIEWIEVIDENGKAYRQFLKPGDNPEALFCIKTKGKLTIREFCNIHGLWKA
ncbi:desulfoferrodoxin [bacterium]|nr:desulfoferrodoxin [bacterium]